MTAANTWHIVTVVFDGTQSTANDRVKVYIDGTQHTGGSYSGTFPTSVGGTVDPFHMGARGTNGYGSGDNTFDGIYDEWAFWKVPLTQANINSLYNSGNAVASNTVESSNLIAYYDFEGTGTDLEAGGSPAQAEVRTNILEQTVTLTPNDWKHVSWVRDGCDSKRIVYDPPE